MCLQMFKVIRPQWISHPKKKCTASDKSNLLGLTDNILKGAFYFMLGVPLTQTQALQLSWPIWTQTQTNLRPTASDRVWVTRCNTFSSDLSLIENGWFRFCVVSFSSLCCVTRRREDEVSGGISVNSGGFSPLTLKAFPSFCLLGKIENRAQIVLGDLSWCCGKRIQVQGLLQGDISRRGTLKGLKDKTSRKDVTFILLLHFLSRLELCCKQDGVKVSETQVQTEVWRKN